MKNVVTKRFTSGLLDCSELLTFSLSNGRADGSVVITFDLDVGEILALGVLDKPSVIIFRLSDERADSVNQRLSVVLHERPTDLQSGALILVEDTRYRIRKLPIGRA